MLPSDATVTPGETRAAAAPPAGGMPLLRGAAQGALIESRQRWRDLAGLAADFAFETDEEGRLSFLAPDGVLGWPAAALLGRRPLEEGLLLRPEPDPFALRLPARDIRAWLRRMDGEAACLSFVVTPLHGPDGRFAGLRGCARDVTAEIAEAEAQANALRRALAVQALVRRVREAVLAPRMLPALLDLLPAAIGCAGAALVELGPDGRLTTGNGAAGTGTVGHRPPPLGDLPALPPHGRWPIAGTAPAMRGGQAVFTRGAGGEPMALVLQLGLAGPLLADPSGPAAPEAGSLARQALLVWREAGARPFDDDERHQLEALSDLLGVVLGNQRLLAELERQARTEVLTGLLNRRAFLDEMRRRMERLRREGKGGVLLFLDVDNLKPVNDRLGHEAGDALLVAVAGLLRRVARPSDMAARLGGDEFALWLDGVAEESIAARRAEALCAGAAATLLTAPGGAERVPVSVSIGVALTLAGAETPEAVLARADAALYAAKRAGRNAWRLAPAGPIAA